MEKTALQIGPPPSPNRDKFPFVGTVNIQGLTIDLENLAGSVREGTGPNGKKWQTKMRYHYGEIRKTTGTDKDKLDVYIGPNPQSKKVFIVHQNFPGSHPKKAGQYDEDKVMLGFNSADEAKRGYLKQYDRKDFFRSITEMSMTQFKKSIFDENKGEKVAAVEPWSEEERRQMATANPQDLARSFYAGAGAYQATGASDDQAEYDRQRRARELTWNAEPELQEKWTRFMEENPGFRPRLVPKTAAAIIKETVCKTPGEKIRSQGKGRGLGTGGGKGPVGVPVDDEDETRRPGRGAGRGRGLAAAILKESAAACKTPGQKLKSKGQGRGAAVGGGKGPQGVPIGDKDTLSNKLRRFSKNRKKDRRPSAYVREKMKVGSLREAYELGAKTAIAAALMPEAPTAEKSTPEPGKAASFGVRMPSPPKGAPPPATSGASSGAIQS